MRTNQCLFMWYLVQTATPKYDFVDISLLTKKMMHLCARKRTK